LEELLLTKAKLTKIITEPITIDLINSNRRILIVDDEPYNIMGIKIILLQSGYQGIVNIIDEAYNGQEAF
jgi:PleD family two-component response regulator